MEQRGELYVLEKRQMSAVRGGARARNGVGVEASCDNSKSTAVKVTTPSKAPCAPTLVEVKLFFATTRHELYVMPLVCGKVDDHFSTYEGDASRWWQQTFYTRGSRFALVRCQ